MLTILSDMILMRLSEQLENLERDVAAEKTLGDSNETWVTRVSEGT